MAEIEPDIYSIRVDQFFYEYPSMEEGMEDVL